MFDCSNKCDVDPFGRHTMFNNVLNLQWTLLCLWFMVLGQAHCSKCLWVCLAEIKRYKSYFRIRMCKPHAYLHNISHKLSFLFWVCRSTSPTHFGSVLQKSAHQYGVHTPKLCGVKSWFLNIGVGFFLKQWTSNQYLKPKYTSRILNEINHINLPL